MRRSVVQFTCINQYTTAGLIYFTPCAAAANAFLVLSERFRLRLSSGIRWRQNLNCRRRLASPSNRASHLCNDRTCSSCSGSLCTDFSGVGVPARLVEEPVSQNHRNGNHNTPAASLADHSNSAALTNTRKRMRLAFEVKFAEDTTFHVSYIRNNPRKVRETDAPPWLPDF